MVEIFVKGSALLLKGYELFHSIKHDYVYGFFLFDTTVTFFIVHVICQYNCDLFVGLFVDHIVQSSR